MTTPKTKNIFLTYGNNRLGHLQFLKKSLVEVNEAIISLVIFSTKKSLGSLGLFPLVKKL